MSKKLYLLRHALTLSATMGQKDRDRALESQGVSDARALGKLMCSKDYHPAQVYCSAAIRTQQTFEALNEAFDPGLKVEVVEKLYDASQGDLLAQIQNTPSEIDSIMIVAHNPGIHALAATLAKEESSSLMGRLSMGYRPGTLTVLECPYENWADIQPAENPLVDLLESLDYNAPATPARWM